MKKFKKVLLIDDDEIVNSINQVIIKHAKFAEDVVALTGVTDAIEFLRKSRDNDGVPEVIFLDLNMPDRNGWDFMDEFNQLDIHETKVVMLTSSISLKDENKAKNSNEIAAFVSKPLSPEMLDKIYEESLQN